MKTKKILHLFIFICFVFLSDIEHVNSDENSTDRALSNKLTVTCYEECRPVYNNYDEGCINLDLQCGSTSPASFTGQLTVNGTAGKVQTKTCDPIYGVCGTAHRTNRIDEPTTGLCSSGTASSVVLGDGYWTWTCGGSRGGGSSTCFANKTCVGPDGKFVVSGGWKKYYVSSSVACGGSCESEIRTCTKGILSGSYTNTSCSVESCITPPTTPPLTPTSTPPLTPLQCTGPDGVVIPSGSNRTYYTSSSVSCGQTCSPQVRRCTNGVLSGTASNRNCSVESCITPPTTPPLTPTSTPPLTPLQCTGPDGVVIPSGSNRIYYGGSSVSCGQSCESVAQTRICTNGVLSGTASNRNCSADACASCTGPDSDTIASGESKTYYPTSSVACGRTCTGSGTGNGNPETRVCTNGTLSGTATNTSCSVTACSCTGPDGATIASGESKTYYTASSVACGRTCGSQTRTCTNGTLSGSATNLSCTVASCDCVGPDGVSIPNTTSRIYYRNTSVACGQSCSSVAETRICTNAVLSGTAPNRNCSPNACLSCTGPDGATITSGDSKTYYSTSSVACGRTCTSSGTGNGNPETRVCTNGTLSGSATNLSCTVASCDCVGPDGTTILNRESKTYYTASSVACGGSCADPISQTRTCTNGVLSGTATNLSCSVALCPDFDLIKGNNMYLNISPAGARSSRTTTTISVKDGFSENITLSASSLELPKGTSYTFTPSTVSSSGYSSGSSLTIYVPTIIPAKVYTVTITGSSGSIVKTVDVLMNVAVTVPPEEGEF